MGAVLVVPQKAAVAAAAAVRAAVAAAAAVRVAVGPVDQASRLLLHVHSGRVDPSKTCVIQRFVKLGRRRRNVTNYGGIIASRLNAKSNVIALGATVVGLVLILMRMRMLPLLPRYIIVLLPPTYALQLSVPLEYNCHKEVVNV